MKYITSVLLVIVSLFLATPSLAQNIPIGMKAETKPGDSHEVLVRNPDGIDRLPMLRVPRLKYGEKCWSEPSRIVSVIGEYGSNLIVRYQKANDLYTITCPTGTLEFVAKGDFLGWGSVKYGTGTIADELERDAIKRILKTQSTKVVSPQASQSCTCVRSKSFYFGLFRDRTMYLEIGDDGRASLSIAQFNRDPKEFVDDSLRFMKQEVEALASKKYRGHKEFSFKFEGHPFWGPHELHDGPMIYKRLYFADCVKVEGTTVRLIAASVRPVGYNPYELGTH